MAADSGHTVLHVLGRLNPSGMERMLQSSAEQFRIEGFRSIVVGQGTEHPFRTELERAGLLVVESRAPIGSLRGFLTMARLKRTLAIEGSTLAVHIHTEGNYARTVASLKFSLWPSAIVRTVHNVFTPRSRGKALIRRIQAAVGDLFLHAITAPSPDVVQNERQFGRACLLIWNWVDPRLTEVRKARGMRRATEDAKATTSALVLGNCSRVKNHEFALRVAQSRNMNLFHLGAESEASLEEKRLLDHASVQARLRQRGVSAPDEAFATCDVLLFPSLNEGMPVSVAEALVVGVPCIVADSPGLRWASEFNSVRVLPLNLEVWQSELDRLEEWSGPESDVSRFDVATGVAAYARLYRREGS